MMNVSTVCRGTLGGRWVTGRAYEGAAERWSCVVDDDAEEADDEGVSKPLPRDDR